MSASYDLHLHSHWSYDANAPVEYYFRTAREKGIHTIALTEHHTMDSLPDVLRTAADYPDIHFIPGAELTVHCSIGAVDMVCLGLPLDTPPELENLFEEYRQWQCATGEAVSAAMLAMGRQYGAAERLKILETYRPQTVIAKQGITHVNWIVQFEEFRKYGWLTDIAEFKKELPNYLDLPRYPAAERVIPAVKKYGGLVFIAHPLNYFQRSNRTRMDQLREELDFDGIECAHTMIPPELTALYRQYCLEHRLLSSAGSDCHSDPPHYHLNVALECFPGRHCGSPEWLREIRDRLILH